MRDQERRRIGKSGVAPNSPKSIRAEGEVDSDDAGGLLPRRPALGDCRPPVLRVSSSDRLSVGAGEESRSFIGGIGAFCVVGEGW